ncbi:DESIGUAL/Modifying wall lignin-1/2 [Dillenia turbinata]|uniref:DESIGUAL/Modifying wall lignin-1/2 n=1 Tax=Dillenia turbinata TaxID=194707 RepID=A0AAN8ZFX9_9MAGN
MERKVVVLCSIVGFLGLLTAALAFGAEATRIKSSQVRFTSDTVCAYPRSPALPLGLTAAVTLVIAQIIVNFGTGCICCKRSPFPSNSNWMLALICYVFSWFTFVIAFLLLLTGAALNDQHGEENMYFGNYYCYVVKPGVFAGGALLSLASVTLGIFYYITLSSAKNQSSTWGSPAAPNQVNIAMGQPLAPPPPNNQDPVFVHEDTYMRRQLA